MSENKKKFDERYLSLLHLAFSILLVTVYGGSCGVDQLYAMRHAQQLTILTLLHVIPTLKCVKFTSPQVYRVALSTPCFVSWGMQIKREENQ